MRTASRAARLRITFLAGLVLANACVWFLALQPQPRLTITFLDVGQGDAIIVQTPAGHTLVVDAGRRTETDDMGRRVVLPFLRSQGINHVDALLLTHPDDDHIGGAATVLERMPTGRLLGSGIPSDAPEDSNALPEAERLQ